LHFVRFLFSTRFLCAILLAGTATASTVEQGLQWFKQGDYQQARDTWLALSEGGDARATFYLSRLYAQGQGVPQDPRLAMEYLASAAAQGDMLAQFNLGNHYYQGKWIEQDPRLAETWWLAAAEQDMPRAQHNLGALYMRGQGVPRDLPLAWYWLERAASNGSTASRELLSRLENRIDAQMLPAQAAPRRDAGASRKKPPPKVVQSPASPVQKKKMPEPAAGTGNALGRGWVLHQPRDSYTLQLIASTSADTVARLRDEYKWKRQVAVYGFSNKGRQFTVMVYGRFPDLKSARAAIDELPARLRRVPPWPRRFADIQDLVK